MKPEIKLTGHKEIDAVFRGLPSVIQDKVLQDTHAASLKYTVGRAKLLAPEGPTGNLVDSLGVIRARGKRSELGLVFAGPRRVGRNRGHHGHLVEYGTKARKNKSGANRGKMTADPFMEPAWNQSKGKVLDSIAVNLGRKLYSFMKRTIRK